MKTEGADDARARLQRWVALDKGGVGTEVRPGKLMINDPYNGPVQLHWQGDRIWGGVGSDEEIATLLKEMGDKLGQ